MRVRIKIGDFSSAVSLQLREGKVFTGGGEYLLPSRVKIVPQENESIAYGARLFIIHGEAKTERFLRSLPSDLSAGLEILEAFTRLDGREIPRYWIVREGFSSEIEARRWTTDAGENLPDLLSHRLQIEGDIFRRYPDLPTSALEIQSISGEVLCRGEILSLTAPEGIIVENSLVGKDFPWQRREDQLFDGVLEARPGETGVLLVNEIPLEQYVASVNSSEMSSNAPLEFLKAQTIAARSTILATRGGHHLGEPFDLCNGDHCQCYYGAVRISPASAEASESTAGIVLTYKGVVADTRYAKICGGIRERFNEVWEDFDPKYLPAGSDWRGEFFPVDNWQDYIAGSPKCFCNPHYYPYPDYLASAAENFRWIRTLSGFEARRLVRERIGIDPGIICRIEPLQQGKSGRINRLAVAGDTKLEIAGELKIRRLLSDTHLPSSCFIVEQSPDGFRLSGAGWGHGVGMCQMGALAMANLGCGTDEILQFYYPGTRESNL